MLIFVPNLLNEAKANADILVIVAMVPQLRLHSSPMLGCVCVYMYFIKKTKRNSMLWEIQDRKWDPRPSEIKKKQNWENW